MHIKKEETMSIIIDADAAKLAGLQIDMLQKVRNGQITFDQWERFNNLSPNDREMRFGDIKLKSKPEVPSEPIEKFALLADLGTITVPDNYVHSTQLESFRKNNGKMFYSYDDNITDQNFSKATVQLTPGRKLHVRAFKQIVHGRTTSEERMEFLAKQNAVHTGAQGLSLVFEKKRDQLPKGFWYASFDEREALWKDADGYRRVPYVDVHSGGHFDFSLGYFECAWRGSHAFLCFCDVEQFLGA